jgi:hypothetical protein
LILGFLTQKPGLLINPKTGFLIPISINYATNEISFAPLKKGAF